MRMVKMRDLRPGAAMCRTYGRSPDLTGGVLKRGAARYTFEMLG